MFCSSYRPSTARFEIGELSRGTVRAVLDKGRPAKTMIFITYRSGCSIFLS
jgi:hypothetical protein